MLLSDNLKGSLLCSTFPSIHSDHSLHQAKTHCFFPPPHCNLQVATTPIPSLSNMQHDAIPNISYNSSMDFTSFFLSQNDTYSSHGFSTILDMVDPYYSCNGGGSSITMSPVLAGEENDQAMMSHGNDERKKRRLVSNRESARRSRVRKQRRLDELSSQVSELRDTNQRLLVELNHMISKHARIVKENFQLREEASHLQKKLSEMEVMELEEAEVAAAAAAPRTL